MMKAETKLAVLAVMAMVATRCACCGQSLSDPLSQEAGMGPKCRKDAGYDAPDGATSWAHAFAALGISCPDEVYAVALSVRKTHGDAEGLIGARKLAAVLVKRIALARVGLVDDKLNVRIDYVKALSALGFHKLAVRIAHSGLGLDVANVVGEGSGVRVAVSRRTFQRKEFKYPSVEAAVSACLGSQARRLRRPRRRSGADPRRLVRRPRDRRGRPRRLPRRGAPRHGQGRRLEVLLA